MKIEKGKLYYNGTRIYKASMDYEDNSGFMSDKIAVHCLNKEGKLYVAEKYNLLTISEFSSDYILINQDDACGKGYIEFRDYHIITIDQFKEFYPEEDYDDPYNWVVNGMNIDTSSEKDDIVQNNGLKRQETFNPQSHYDNSRGSLYKVANELNINHWEFDIFKRLVRCRKKGQFKQDLQKIKDTIDIYINEYDRNI